MLEIAKETVFFPIKTRKSGRINYKYISCPTISTSKINTGKTSTGKISIRKISTGINQYRENQYRENQTRKSGIYRLLQYTRSHGIYGMKALFFDFGPGNDRDTGIIGVVPWLSPTE